MFGYLFVDMKAVIEVHVYADFKSVDGGYHNYFVGLASVECENIEEYWKGVDLVKEIFYSGLKEKLGDKGAITIMAHTK